MADKSAYDILTQCNIRPSVQRLEIMEYLMKNDTHPTVEDVYAGLCSKMPTLSRTTVYNTLRLLSEHDAARMITIDEHRVCYDGNTNPHVHFYCKKCGRVIDFFDEPAPTTVKNMMIDGNSVDEMQLYYKGICSRCLSGQQDNK